MVQEKKETFQTGVFVNLDDLYTETLGTFVVVNLDDF